MRLIDTSTLEEEFEGLNNNEYQRYATYGKQQRQTAVGNYFKERVPKDFGDQTEFDLSFDDVVEVHKVANQRRRLDEDEWELENGTIKLDESTANSSNAIVVWLVPEVFKLLELMYALKRIASRHFLDTGNETENTRLERLEDDIRELKDSINQAGSSTYGARDHSEQNRPSRFG